MQILTFCADGVGVSDVTNSAGTNSSVLLHAALGIDTTAGGLTGVLTCFLDASQMLWTLRVCATFGLRC